jgi:hypothetical protein
MCKGAGPIFAGLLTDRAGKDGRPSGAKQAAEKGRDLGEIGEKHTSGAKGRIDSAAFMPGLKPGPTLDPEFFRML